jgi:hypothetical protein
MEIYCTINHNNTLVYVFHHDAKNENENEGDDGRIRNHFLVIVMDTL